MNCKPGDMAIVISDDDAQNIGRIVQVLEPAKWVTGNAWWCSATGAPLLARQFDDYNRTYFAYEADIYDDCLRPVSGLPVTDDITDEVTA